MRYVAIRLCAPVAALLLFPTAASTAATDASLRDARMTLMAGRIDQAIAQLQPLVQGGASGPALLLLCRAYNAKDAKDDAVHACEDAVKTMGDSSEAQDWMGRVYGAKASRAGALSGYSLAKKVAAAFAASVRLDPKNNDAADDLGEFYVQAPGLVGGGLDRAQQLEKQLETTLPNSAQRLRGEIAEKNKDYGTAEREFRARAEHSNAPDAWADLANYYQRRNQPDQAVDAARRSIVANRTHDSSLVAAAAVLLHMHQDLPAAMAAVRSYLAGNALTDAAPAPRAHTLLGRLLAATGDKAGARTEFQTALSLASGYGPAQKGLDSL